MWILIKSFLPKAGINRFIRREVLYATPAAQGLGLKDIYLTQGVQHINELVEHVWKQSITGQFLLSSLEHLRLEIGVNGKILQLPYKKFAPIILTNSWLQQTWEFMNEYKIKLDVNVPDIPLLRERDIPIMKAILDQGQITNKDLAIVNKCRVYLKIFLLSEITTGCGKKITDKAWHGIQTNENAKTRTKWPNWKKPTLRMWTVWRDVLHRVFCSQKRKILDNNLGKWLGFPEQWNWFLYKNHLVFKDNNQKMYLHKFQSGSARRREYCLLGNIIEETEDIDLVPTTIKMNENSVTDEGSVHTTEARRPTQVNSNDYNQWLHYTCDTVGNVNDLLLSLEEGTAIAVSDGSCYQKDGIGTAAWVITDVFYKPIAVSSYAVLFVS